MEQKVTAQNIFYGYKCGKESFEINEGRAAVVKLIYMSYSDGKSLTEIAEILEGIGVLSPRKKTKWGKQILSNILSNPVYLGTEEYPAIISEELYNKVQEIKVKNTKGRKR